MKQILSLLLICISIVGYSQTRIGFTAGVNMSEGFDKDFKDAIYNPKASYNFGITLDQKLGNRLSIEPMLLLSNKGWIDTYNNIDEVDNSLQYLSSQILGKIHFTKNIKLIAGPEFSFLLNAKNGDDSIPRGIYSDGEVGLVGGLEISLLNRIAIHAKYNHGLNSVLDINYTDFTGNPVGSAEIKNRAFMLGVTLYPFKVEVN